MYLLDTNPVSTQHITEPMPTPPRVPMAAMPMAAATITMVVSEHMRTIPTSFLMRSVREYTNPSPGSMTAPATICRYTPIARMTMPIRTQSTWTGSESGLRPSNSAMDRSTRYPKRKHTTTSTARSALADGSAFFQSVNAAWNAMSMRLNAATYTPMLSSGNASSRLYGIAVMGDVPRSAFVMNPTANDMSVRPARKTR